MRQWFVGSALVMDTPGALSVPTKAFTYFPGVQNTTDAVRYGYPKLMTDNQFAEIMSRVQQWTIALSWHMSGTLTSSGDTIDETGAWAAVTQIHTEFNETNLFDALPTSGVQNGFLVTSTSYNVTRVVNGTPTTIASTTTGSLFLVASQTGVSVLVTPYTYRSDLLQWLPRVEFGGSTDNGFLVGVNSAYDPGPTPPDFTPQTFSGNFMGAAMEVHCYIPDGLTLDSADLAIDPFLWYPYEPSGPGTAIYDTATGLVIPGQTPITQDF